MDEKWRFHFLMKLDKNINELNCLDTNSSMLSLCYTPLLYAIYQNDIEIVNELLNSGADVNIPKDNLPLGLALSQNQEKIVNLLIQSGAKLNNTYYARLDIYESDNPKFLKLLDNNKSITLEKIYCEVYGKYNLLEHLLKKGVNPDYLCNENKYVSSDCNKTVAKDKWTKLFTVSDLDGFEGKNNARVTQLLIDFNATVDYKDDCNNTPLHYAAKTQSVYIVKTLLKNDALIDIVNCEGKTAYDIAQNDKWVLKAFEEHIKNKQLK